MIIEIDHILLAARDPDAAAADLADALGLAPAGGGVHAAIGTRNGLLSLAGPYLELIGLADDQAATRELASRHPIGAAVLAALATPAGPAPLGYVCMALRADDVGRTVADLVTSGRRPGDVSEVVRRRPDGSVVRWPVALPHRLGPTLPPFLIEHAPDEPERAARVAGGGPRLVEIVLPVDDPASVAAGWDDALGLASAPTGSAPEAIAVGPHRVLLRPGVVGGPSVLRLTGGVGRARSVERGGVRIDLG